MELGSIVVGFLAQWWWLLLSTIVVAIAGTIGRKMVELFLVAIGVDRLYAQAKAKLEGRTDRKILYRLWTLAPAPRSELQFILTRLNSYLHEHERVSDLTRMTRFYDVRPDDYLVLRGPVDGRDGGEPLGAAIIHPLLTRFGEKFHRGLLVGRDLEPRMISRSMKSRYFYVSFAEALQDKFNIMLAEKVLADIARRGSDAVCVIARPTTERAIRILSERGFTRCWPLSSHLEIGQTCSKWIVNSKSPL